MSTYTDLITSQHRGKPRFEALVDLGSSAFSDIAEMVATIPCKYDLDLAVGAQLDTVGEWVGLSRYIGVELSGVYFSTDDAALGLDAGIFKGPFDSGVGFSRLDDETYRMVLKAKIGANHWDGSVEALQLILDQVFDGYGTAVFTGDHQDMSMSFYMVGATPPPVITALLTGGYLAVKPSGIDIRGYFKPSVNNSPFFALDGSGEYAAGFDSGSMAISI